MHAHAAWATRAAAANGDGYPGGGTVYCVESNIIGTLAIILWGECGDSSVEARGLAPGTSRAQQSLEPAVVHPGV
jgi:hypothetical protein